MLNKITFALFAALLSLTACSDLNDLLTFHVNDQTQIRIESAPIGLLEVATPDVTSNSQQEFNNNNTHTDLVRDVRLEQLKLTITAPEAKTFSFLKSIHVYISAPDVDEIQLASLENISSSVSTLELIPTDQKLDAYVKSSSYTLRTKVVTDEMLNEDVDILIDLKFRVTADAF